MRKHFREKSALVSSLSLSRVPKEVPAAAGKKVSLLKIQSEKCVLGKVSKEITVFLGKSPKLWVGGGKES